LLKLYFAKLRHRDVKNALLAPWSLKTTAAQKYLKSIGVFKNTVIYRVFHLK